jgi:hypothetical protein
MNINPAAFEELRHLLSYHNATAEGFRKRLAVWANEPYTSPRRLRSIENAQGRLALHEAAGRALDILFDAPVYEIEVVVGGSCCSAGCKNETPDGSVFCEVHKLEIVDDTPSYDYRSDLSCFFGLTYASWLTLPRVLMEAMPEEWKARAANLLHDYEDAIKNPPDFGTVVRLTFNGKLVKMPDWLGNYRHPDRLQIDHVMGRTSNANA